MADKQSKEMAKLAYDALADKKAQDIKIINIEGVSVIADYFIIASGTNHNQVQAMADSVDEALHKAGHPAISPLTGFCWIMATSSYMYLIRRTVFSTIWSVSGEMGKRFR